MRRGKAKLSHQLIKQVFSGKETWQDLSKL